MRQTIAALGFAFIALNGREAYPRDETATVDAGLVGSWVASLSHAGETRPVGFTFERTPDGGLLARFSNPAIHIWDVPVAKATLEGSTLRLGALASLAWDAAAGTLSGDMPKAFIPVYAMHAVFRRGTLDHAPRPELTAPVAKPAWVFDAGAPVWADVSCSGGVVYAGAEDGRLHALDARSGKEAWALSTGGAIRARTTRAGADVFVQSDDGNLYRVDASTGALRFKVKVNERPVERLPPGEKSRYDRVASAATLADGRLFLGTQDGHVLALDPSDGRRLWAFAAGDLVISTPVVDAGRVYFGSFDGHVYAVDAASGTLAWKHDTGGAVASTPALHSGRVVVGSRSYDLSSLDAATGAPAWTRYIWFSWVESPASILGETLYVGSSDAAKVYAMDTATGRSAWEVDVHGWAWGQPAVTEGRVFVGTSATPHYVVGHDAALLALDRRTGALAWRFPMVKPSEEVTYGFPAAVAVGDGLVFAGALDGRVYAFTQ